MKFDKYARFGSYHWKQYADNTKYRRHADRVVEWITELSVLDIGAGDGKITALLKDAGKTVIGIDNEPEAVRLAHEKGASVHLGSAYELPYPDYFFNSALMADVLEHFEKPLIALREARRVIRECLYISTPPKRSDGKLTDRYHYFELTPAELVAMVEQVGFALVGEIDVVPADKIMYAKFIKRG